MKDLIDHITDNCTPVDREELFDQMLDENYSFENVGGPFGHMVPSQVLKEMDPTAYRCGVNDYMDGEETYEIEGDTYWIKDVEAARDGFVEELEAEVESLQEEITELCNDDDQVITPLFDSEHQKLIESLGAAVKRLSEAEKYSF